MKTAIIGGGKGCRAILEMIVQERLQVLSPEIICVVDPNPDAPGMVFAREHGWKTLSSMEEALNLADLELVIELTGRDDILEELYRLIPMGIRVMDHVLARVFWDLDNVKINLRHELEQKIAFEAQLRKDRRQLQQILDSIPDAVLVMNREGEVERVNARFHNITGLKIEDLCALKCFDPFTRKEQQDAGACNACTEFHLCFGSTCRKYDPNAGEKAICPFEHVFQTGRATQFVQTDSNNSGQESYYEITANPIFDEEGNIVRVVETARLITEQVMLKRETEENEQRFRQFIDNAHDMITIKDAGGRYLVINPKAAALFGKKPDDFLGKTDFEVFPHKLAKILTAKDKKTIEKGEYSTVEETLELHGHEFYLDTVRFPLFDYKGDVTGVCSITRDVTQQKSLQRAVIQSEKLAAVGKLAASVAHELNNPLTGILTFAEELKMDADPYDPIVQDFDTIIREAMRCRQIVRDLLDYARLSRPQRQSMNINHVVERSLSLVRKQAAFHDVTFDLKLANDLPDLNIDPNQMQQVFLNLIINAAEAMKNAGKIYIRSFIAPDGRSVEVSVQDEGPGISPEMLKHIFEPFYSTKGELGNGLGLNVVQSIVDQHGGNIQVESEVGKGATFRIMLPASQSEERSLAHG